jgi:hypothetical protein
MLHGYQPGGAGTAGAGHGCQGCRGWMGELAAWLEVPCPWTLLPCWSTPKSSASAQMPCCSGFEPVTLTPAALWLGVCCCIPGPAALLLEICSKLNHVYPTRRPASCCVFMCPWTLLSSSCTLLSMALAAVLSPGCSCRWSLPPVSCCCPSSPWLLTVTPAVPSLNPAVLPPVPCFRSLPLAAHRGHLHLGGGLLGDLADEVQVAIASIQGDLVPAGDHLLCNIQAKGTSVILLPM